MRKLKRRLTLIVDRLNEGDALGNKGGFGGKFPVKCFGTVAESLAYKYPEFQSATMLDRPAHSKFGASVWCSRPGIGGWTLAVRISATLRARTPTERFFFRK